MNEEFKKFLYVQMIFDGVIAVALVLGMFVGMLAINDIQEVRELIKQLQGY
jgi:hypothetical protein